MRPHLLVAALLALAAGTTQASHILPAFSVDGTDCDATIQPFTPFNAYIVAVLGGDAAAGA